MKEYTQQPVDNMWGLRSRVWQLNSQEAAILLFSIKNNERSAIIIVWNFWVGPKEVPDSENQRWPKKSQALAVTIM